MPQQLSLFDVPPREGPPQPPGPAGGGRRGSVVVAHGALAAEAALLAEADRLLSRVAADPSLLARPVLVVVPSRSLRLHVAAVLARRSRAMAGIAVRTLHGLALEVLERSGEPAPRGDMLAEVLARRLARGEPALRRGLDDLVDGFAGAAGTVRDLLDAGLEPAHAAAAEEALAADGPGLATRGEVERARALVRVAAATAAELARLGLGRVSTLLSRAAGRVVADPDRALPARAVLIHGFAEATGVATDLIEALVRHHGARVILDRPPDPGSPGAVERAFADRLAERLSPAVAGRPQEAGAAGAPPRLDSFAGAGADAEVREVALRVRGLLDAGALPERIGVAARDLGPYRLVLARHFDRLGVPFSATGTRGALGPAGRRVRALLDLLRRREETPASRWLDAVSLPGPDRTPGFDLRLALSALGAGRLRDVAELDLGRLLRGGSYALPIRRGFMETEVAGSGEEPAEDEGAAGPDGHRREVRAPRRRISGERLERAVAAAARLARRLARWPAEARFAEHRRHLLALLREDLGWDPGNPVYDASLIALNEVDLHVPAGFPLAWEELRLLLAGVLAGAGTAELGGRGGGVQVLSVVEARGRTFERLFVLGLNRDLFPRPVREDPLLPDDLRRVLARVLPDVPLKRSGFDEERYLFAQLLSASPEVTLSWQSADDDGRPRPASPLVERIRLDGGEPRRAPGLWAAPSLDGAPAAAAGRAPGPALARPAWEHAVLAALHGPRHRFGAVLPHAVAEARAELAGGALALDPARIAAARLAVLSELDPDRRTPEGRAAARRLGPYFGLVGAIDPENSRPDPRRRDLAVTHVERLAGCPWQFFLTRVLAVEPTPDPLQALPGVDARLVGNVVHAVLDRIAWSEGMADDLADLRARLAAGDGPPPVPWPPEEEVERLLREASARIVEEEGIALRGMARALALRARPFLAAAREEWTAAAEFTGLPGLPILASEVTGELAVAGPDGAAARLSFRADRAELLPDGGLLLTDYKTGKPLAEGKREDARREKWLREVRSGRGLQAVAYALAAGPAARGRYLYLKPEAEARDLGMEAGDEELAAAFAAAAAAVLGVYAAGSFFPRVVDPEGRSEPRLCQLCEVAEACQRGDSGARRRLLEWADRGEPEGFWAEALLGVWRLTAKDSAKENGRRAAATPEAG